jgi:hypothetical protein
MKVGFQSIVLLVFLVFIGCKKVDKFTQFNMDFEEIVTIPSSTGMNLPINVFTPDVETNSESTFAINDTRKDLVEEILLTELSLTVLSPPNEDFSFLESIEVFISAPNHSEQKIAWNNNVSSTAGRIIVLETTELDLKEYIKSDEFSLRLKTTTDELLSSDYEIQVNSSFFVDAKILGQ